MTLSAPVRGAIALIGAVALGAGSLTLSGSATAAPSGIQPPDVAVPAASRAPLLPSPDPDYAMPKIPVWVNMGDKGLAGVTVSVRDGRGKVRVTARTNSSGVVLIPRSFLRGKHSLEVTGGRAWERLGRPTLSTGELIEDRNAAIIISPLTAIAHRVAKLTGASYTSALLRTRKAFGIASHVDHVHAAASHHVFHTGQLHKWSKKHGSLHAGMDHLAKQIANGKTVPSFRPKQEPQTRDDVSTEAWVGEQIMSGVLSGSGSKGASIVIGDLFGADDPTTAELSSINSELSKIVTELATIESTLQQLVNLMEQTSFQVLNAGMADVAGAVNGNGTGTGLWAVYLSATTLDPTSPSYEADLSGFAASFYNGVYSILPSEVGELFDTPTSPGLLHQVYNFNTAPWWDSSDIASISSIIDYYGTIQAQAVALINEAWWGPNPAYSLTPDDINSFNTSDYGPQNTDIYLSMPTQIDTASIAFPSNQMIFKAFPGAFDTVYDQRAGYPDEYLNCSNMDDEVKPAAPWPVKVPDTATWDDSWAGYVGSGWTLQPSSSLVALNKTRELPNSSGKNVATYPLPTLASGVPDAFAVVAQGFYPLAGYAESSWFDVPPVPQFWMLCDSAAVSILNTSEWVENFYAYPGYYMPSDWGAGMDPDQMGWMGLPFPVGVLGGQQGSFRYVAPS